VRHGWRWAAAGGAAGFATLAVPIAIDGGPLPGDERVLVELHDLRGDAWDEPLTRLADLTDLLPLAILAAVLAGGLVWARRWRDLGYGVAVVGVVWVVNPVLKELFARARPDLWPPPMEVSEHSFPSGHAANTAALAAAVVLVTWRTRARLPALVAGSVLVLVVGTDQLALGVHYPSDLLAGWLWAGAWAAAVWAVRGSASDRAREPSGPPPPPGSPRSSRS
jgi:membrane-associated phospholipid phosphatase